MAIDQAPRTRAAQRRRTRQAIVDATARLLTVDPAPTVDAIAAAAEVSRRTVYLHFPSLDQLLLDAALGELSATPIEAAIDAGLAGGDPFGGVWALIDGLYALPPQAMTWGRMIVRLTVATDAGKDDVPRRGFRRISWIERACEPLRVPLGPRGFADLVSALAVVIGFEAMIVLHDLRGLDDDEARRITRTTARAVLDAALAAATRDEARAGERERSERE